MVQLLLEQCCNSCNAVVQAALTRLVQYTTRIHSICTIVRRYSTRTSQDTVQADILALHSDFPATVDTSSPILRALHHRYLVEMDKSCSVVGSAARRKLLAGKLCDEIPALEDKQVLISLNENVQISSEGLKRVYSLHVFPEMPAGPVAGTRGVRDLFYIRKDALNFNASYGTPVRKVCESNLRLSMQKANLRRYFRS